MATADTVDLGPPHEPKEESISVFGEIEHELKKHLVHTRHEHNKHEKEYFEAVNHLSDAELAGFGPEDFREVRVAVTAHGIILFGKVRIPAMPDDGPAYTFEPLPAVPTIKQSYIASKARKRRILEGVAPFEQFSQPTARSSGSTHEIDIGGAGDEMLIPMRLMPPERAWPIH